jgi:mycothiol synthase
VELLVRPFADDDRARWVEIGRLNDPESPPSLEQLRRADRAWDDRFFRLRLVAEAAGRVVGVAEARHSPDQFHPDKYRLHVEVDPAAQRRGVGTALYAAVELALRERGALSLRAVARGGQPACLAFLTRRGFVEVARAWESWLDVPSFDFAPFAAAAGRVAGQGIRIATLAGEERPLEPLYRLYLECERDAPSVDPRTPITFEQFLAQFVDTPLAIPEATFLAFDGDRLVGLSVAQRHPSLADVLEQDMTGVEQGYRRRGIAMALKLRVIGYARAAGARELRTTNSSSNRPMLRINEALGFRKRAPNAIMLKELG